MQSYAKAGKCWRRALLLSLVMVLVSPRLRGQQPQAVDRDSHARVETPDPSVNAVDPDPQNPNRDPEKLTQELEKLKHDAPAQPRTLSSYSTWGPQLREPQEPASDFSPKSPPASTWGQKNVPVHEMSLFDQNRAQDGGAQARTSKTATDTGNHGVGQQLSIRIGEPGFGQRKPGQPSTKLAGDGSLAPSARYPSTRIPAGHLSGEYQAPSVDFGAPLAFNPAKKLVPYGGGVRHQFGASASQPQADPYCRAPITTQAKLRCARSQQNKKANKSGDQALFFFLPQ